MRKNGISDTPEPLRPFVNDYKIHVFDIAFLSDEQLKMFKSDFRIVAEYFVCRRKHQEFSLTKRVPEHVDAVLKMLSAMTGDKRFSEGCKVFQDESKVKKTLGLTPTEGKV